VSRTGPPLPRAAACADLLRMTAAARPAGIPTPRHRAPDAAPSAPQDGPRHRAAADEDGLRVAVPAERARPGRHADPEDADAAVAGEDPLAWLGFRFETA
jgi:hypothetical protein